MSFADIPLFHATTFSKQNEVQVVSSIQRKTGGVRKAYFDSDGRLTKMTFAIARDPICDYSMTNDYAEAYPYFIPSRVEATIKNGTKARTTTLKVTKCTVDKGVDESLFKPKSVNLKRGVMYFYSDEKNRITPRYYDGFNIVMKPSPIDKYLPPEIFP